MNTPLNSIPSRRTFCYGFPQYNLKQDVRLYLHSIPKNMVQWLYSGGDKDGINKHN